MVPSEKNNCHVTIDYRCPACPFQTVEGCCAGEFSYLDHNDPQRHAVDLGNELEERPVRSSNVLFGFDTKIGTVNQIERLFDPATITRPNSVHRYRLCDRVQAAALAVINEYKSDRILR